MKQTIQQRKMAAMKTLLATAAFTLLSLGAQASVETYDTDVVNPAQSSCTDGMVFEYRIHWVFQFDANYVRTTYMFHGTDTATGEYILNGIGRDMFVFDPYDPFDSVHTIQFDQRVTGKGGRADFHVHMTQQVHRDGTVDEPHYFITCEP